MEKYYTKEIPISKQKNEDSLVIRDGTTDVREREEGKAESKVGEKILWEQAFHYFATLTPHMNKHPSNVWQIGSWQ